MAMTDDRIPSFIKPRDLAEEKPMVDMDKLANEVNDELKRYAPPATRRVPPPSPTMSNTPLQSIARDIKKLVWEDAERFAELIESHRGEGPSNKTTTMARAVQLAASDLLKEVNE